MVGIIVSACMVSHTSHHPPIFAVNLDGMVRSPRGVEWRPGTKLVPVPGGQGIEFDGASSGLMIRDNASFAIQRAITVCAWIKPSAYVSHGPGAQILFRGDDRPGLDPYSLVLHPDGRIYFAITDESQNSPNVSAAVPLNEWTHVLASFNASSGELKMYKDGVLASEAKTKSLPLKELDSFCAPGVGIGNVQWNGGPHNQPFKGVLADLRLYNAVLTPKAVGFNPKYWKSPLP